MKSSPFLHLFCVGTVLVLAQAARANLVQNPGFEDATTGSGASYFPDWTLSGNLSYYSLSTDSHTGLYAAQIGPYAPPIDLSQTITTTAGDDYTLSFWLMRTSGLSGGGDEDQDAGSTFFDVYWNTASASAPVTDAGDTVALLDALTLSTGSSSFPYTEFTYTGLAATTGSTTFTFGIQSPPSYWWLDDVSVTDNGPGHHSVPDQAVSLWVSAVLMLGLCALSGRAIRRKAA